jgi:hypothetical protein
MERFRRYNRYRRQNRTNMLEPMDTVTTTWTDRIQRIGNSAMKASRFVVVAQLLAIATITGVASASAQSFFGPSVPNNAPLTFGMDANEVSWVLGTELIYIRGRPGDELYLALPNVKGSALASRKDGLYLQFRRGRLEGWKGDWATNRPCCNY